MATRLRGLNPLSYIGVDPVNPTQAVIYKRNPSINDCSNFTLQCQWLNSQTQQLWVLVSQEGGRGTWKEITGGGGGSGIQTITGDVGTAVGPDGSNNIDLQGGGPYVFTGNPGANLLTLTDDGTVAYTYTGDSGVATPSANNLNIVGSGIISTSGSGDTLTITASGSVPISIDVDSGGPVTPSGGVLNVYGGNNITTTGAGNTITVDVTGTTDDAVQVGNASGSLTSLPLGTDGQIIIGATGATPLFADLTSTDMSVTITQGPNTLDLSVAGAGPGVTTIHTDSGDATPSGGTLNVYGDSSHIQTTGAGNTVTAELYGFTDNAPVVGNASGSLDSLSPMTTGELMIGVTGSVPNLARLTAGSNITIDDTSVPGEITISSSGGGVGTAPSQIVGPGTTTLNTNSGINYTTLFAGTGGTAANRNYVMPVAGTFSLLYTYVGTNTDTGSNSITFQVNNVNTLLSVNYPAGTTGVFSDLVHSVSVNVGDVVSFELSQTTTAFSISGVTSLTFTPSSGGGGSGDLVLLETQTVSGVTEVVFTSGITNTYRDFVLMFDNVPSYSPTASPISYWSIQLSTDNGVSYINSGYLSDGSGSYSSGMSMFDSASVVNSDAIAAGAYKLFNLTSGVGYITGSNTGNKYSPLGSSITGTNRSAGYNTSIVVNALRVALDSPDLTTIDGTFSLYGYVV